MVAIISQTDKKLLFTHIKPKYMQLLWKKKRYSCANRPIEPSVIFIGSLSKDVFEGRTSTGSEPFSLFICLDANKFVLLSFFSLIKRIYPRVSNKPLPNDAKGPLPVDVRRSTTLLLKLPITKLRDTARSRVTHGIACEQAFGRAGN